MIHLRAFRLGSVIVQWRNARLLSLVVFSAVGLVGQTAYPATPILNKKIDVPTCSPRLKQLTQKANLVIVYVFGYKDARPARFVGDGYERLQLVDHLTRPCGKNQNLCGFKRHKEDGYIFEKQIMRNQEQQRVIFQLVASSASEDDDENRELSFQTWKSRRARQTLIRGLQQADVVFYNGHSRSGGGPDFDPPVLTATKGVNYDHYLVGRSQFKLVLETLGKAKAPPTLLGLFSCRADDLFRSELEALNKGVTLLAAPHLISYQEALRDSIFALEAILAGHCDQLSRLYESKPK